MLDIHLGVSRLHKYSRNAAKDSKKGRNDSRDGRFAVPCQLVLQVKLLQLAKGRC